MSKHFDSYIANKFSASPLSVPEQYAPYRRWEEAFIRRWGLVPRHNSRLAYLYIDDQNWEHDRMMTIDEAARAFHVNEFDVPQHMLSQLRAMEHDFDKVAPEIVEEPTTAEDWDKYQQQEEAFDPRNPSRRGRTLFLPGSR